LQAHIVQSLDLEVLLEMSFFGEPSLLLHAWDALPVLAKILIDVGFYVPILVHAFHLLEEPKELTKALIEIHQLPKHNKNRQEDQKQMDMAQTVSPMESVVMRIDLLF